MSTSSGIPALDLPTRMTSGATARILATTGMSSSGPFPQLPPIAFAPHSASARTARSGGTPIIEGPRLLCEHIDRLVELEEPHREHERTGRPDVAGDERGPVRRIDLRTRQDGRHLVDLADVPLVAVKAQPQPVATERVREDDPRPRVEVGPVDLPDHRALGKGETPHLGRIPELESGRKEHRAHRPVRKDGCPAPDEGFPACPLDGGRNWAGGRGPTAFLVRHDRDPSECWSPKRSLSDGIRRRP